MPGNEAFAPVSGDERRSLFGIAHRVNTLGLRGPDRPIEKPPGVARVAVLGDSVVWGWGVAEEDGMVARLEARLGSRGSAYDARLRSLGYVQ